MDTKLDPGALVAGRYRLERVLGEGGMGVVWAATHVHTRKTVAIKLVKRAANETQRARFLREARASCAVPHPHVREIYDVLEGDDGAPMMVMEYLSGESLAKRLDREGTLALPETAALLLPVVSAVGAAHALGIVHRDLKPENIFLDEGPPRTVKVLDFGIAKLTAQEGAAAATATITASGALVGTPCYMSPEQAFGEKDLDHRADVWALGLILYRCLSGVLPTQAKNLGQVFKNIVARPIRSLADAAPGVPADVAALVDRMLSRARKHRPGDLHEVAEVLERHTDTRAPDFGPPAVPPREQEVGGAAMADEPSVDGAGPVDPVGDTEASAQRSGTVVAGTQPPTARSAPAKAQDVSQSRERPGDASGTALLAPPPGSPTPLSRWRWLALAGTALGYGAMAAYTLAHEAEKGPPALASSATAPAPAPAKAALVKPIPEASPPASPVPAREQDADASTATPPPASGELRSRPTIAPARSATERLRTATSSAAAPPAPAPGLQTSGQPSTDATPGDTHTPAEHASAAAKPHCNPPYTFDASGTKIFNKECL